MSNEWITGIIKLLFFLSYLMVIGLVIVEYQYEKQEQKRHSRFLLYFSMFITWMIIFLDIQNYHTINYFITMIFILNLIIFINVLESSKFSIIFNINLLISVYFLDLFGHNPIINVYITLIVLVVHLFANFTLKRVEFNFFEYVFHGITMATIVGIYILGIYQDLYHFSLFFTICFINVLVFLVCHKVIFYHNTKLSEFIRESIYDLDSNTLSTNYLYLKMAELNRKKRSFQIYFIDVYYPKYNMWYEDTITDNQFIHELTKVVKRELSEHDLFGRINLKRFCIVLTSKKEKKVENIQKEIEQLNGLYEGVTFNIVKDESNSIGRLEISPSILGTEK